MLKVSKSELHVASSNQLDCHEISFIERTLLIQPEKSFNHVSTVSAV